MAPVETEKRWKFSSFFLDRGRKRKATETRDGDHRTSQQEPDMLVLDELVE